MRVLEHLGVMLAVSGEESGAVLLLDKELRDCFIEARINELVACEEEVVTVGSNRLGSFNLVVFVRLKW